MQCTRENPKKNRKILSSFICSVDVYFFLKMSVSKNPLESKKGKKCFKLELKIASKKVEQCDFQLD